MVPSNGQGTASSTTGSMPVVTAGQTPVEVLLRNTDPALVLTLYWGVSPGVTGTLGVPLDPGESVGVTLNTGESLYAWAASATSYAWAAVRSSRSGGDGG